MTPSQTGLETLVAALEALRIEYLIGGSVASSVFGIHRATNDVDILAAIRPSHVPGLVERLSADFIAFEDDILAAIQAGQSFNLIHRKTTYKFDIFPPKTPFHRSQLQRARRLPVTFLGTGFDVPIATPEDILIAKLIWFRAGGEISGRQWYDISGVVQVQTGRLDLDYLRHWAEATGVSDLLARALNPKTS
jgi:hypothetical protein